MIVGNEAYCRQCAAPLSAGLPPTSPVMRRLIGARRFVLLNAIFAPVLCLLLAMPVTALIGGPALAALGLALAWAARRTSYANAVRLGLVQALVALVWVAFVWLLQVLIPLLQTVRGHEQLAGIGAVFFASLWVWQNHPARDLRFQCDHCGYWIKGLVVPRCPECGHSFDPARLE